MAKDLRLALETAADLSVSLEQTGHLKKIYDQGMAAGWSEDDFIGLMRFIDKNHDVSVKRDTLRYIDLSKHRNSPATEIITGFWNHSVKMRETTGEKGVSWPRIKQGEMADLLEFIRNPVKN